MHLVYALPTLGPGSIHITIWSLEHWRRLDTKGFNFEDHEHWQSITGNHSDPWTLIGGQQDRLG